MTFWCKGYELSMAAFAMRQWLGLVEAARFRERSAAYYHQASLKAMELVLTAILNARLRDGLGTWIS